MDVKSSATRKRVRLGIVAAILLLSYSGTPGSAEADEPVASTDAVTTSYEVTIAVDPESEESPPARDESTSEPEVPEPEAPATIGDSPPPSPDIPVVPADAPSSPAGSPAPHGGSPPVTPADSGGPPPNCTSPPQPSAPTWCPPPPPKFPPSDPNLAALNWAGPAPQLWMEPTSTYVGEDRVDPGPGATGMRQAYREIFRAEGQLQPFSGYVNGQPHLFVPGAQCEDHGGQDDDCLTHTWIPAPGGPGGGASTLIDNIFYGIYMAFYQVSVEEAPAVDERFDDQAGCLVVNGVYFVTPGPSCAPEGVSEQPLRIVSQTKLAPAGIGPVGTDVSTDKADVGPGTLPYALVRVVLADLSAAGIENADGTVPELVMTRITKSGTEMDQPIGTPFQYVSVLQAFSPLTLIETPYINSATFSFYGGVQPYGPQSPESQPNQPVWCYVDNACPWGLPPVELTYGPNLDPAQGGGLVQTGDGRMFLHVSGSASWQQTSPNEDLNFGSQRLPLGPVYVDEGQGPRFMDMTSYFPQGEQAFSYSQMAPGLSFAQFGFDWIFEAAQVASGVRACVRNRCKEPPPVRTGEPVKFTTAASNVGLTLTDNACFRLTVPAGVTINASQLPPCVGQQATAAGQILFGVPDEFAPGLLAPGKVRYLTFEGVVTAGWDGPGQVLLDVVYGSGRSSQVASTTLFWASQGDDPPGTEPGDPPPGGDEPSDGSIPGAAVSTPGTAAAGLPFTGAGDVFPALWIPGFVLIVIGFALAVLAPGGCARLRADSSRLRDVR